MGESSDEPFGTMARSWPMPRFHLHLHNGLGFTPDDEGLEFADAAAARKEAIRSIRSIVSEEVKQGSIDLNGRVEIVDEHGQFVAGILFTDAVVVQPGSPR
jgi:hypothetical protein